MSELISAPSINTAGGLDATSVFPVTDATGATLYQANGADIAAAYGGTGGGGSVALLDRQSVSTVGEVIFVAFDAALYDSYFIEMTDVYFNANARLKGNVSTDGGATWQTGSNYINNLLIIDTAVTPNYLSGYGFLWFTGLHIGGNTSLKNFFKLEINNPANATCHKLFKFTGTGYNSGSVLESYVTSCAWTINTAIDAIKLWPDNGQISGVFSLYGLKKT